jgi:hypothetical protein
MTVIRTFDDEHEVCCDADALDALQVEVEREGASGADVVEVAGNIIDARKSGYGTGISISRPVAALLTTSPDTPAQAFAGYWQPDGSWRDADGGPGGLELAQTITDHLSSGDTLTPGAVLSVAVQFLSFRGESPESRTWTRESIGNGVELPTCRIEN